MKGPRSFTRTITVRPVFGLPTTRQVPNGKDLCAAVIPLGLNISPMWEPRALVLGAYILMFPQERVNVVLGRQIVAMRAIFVLGKKAEWISGSHQPLPGTVEKGTWRPPADLIIWIIWY